MTWRVETINYGSTSHDIELPHINVTRMGDPAPVYWATTGLVTDPPTLMLTPCAYCGRKAPANVCQCLGCGAPR